MSCWFLPGGMLKFQGCFSANARGLYGSRSEVGIDDKVTMMISTTSIFWWNQGYPVSSDKHIVVLGVIFKTINSTCGKMRKKVVKKKHVFLQLREAFSLASANHPPTPLLICHSVSREKGPSFAHLPINKHQPNEAIPYPTVGKQRWNFIHFHPVYKNQPSKKKHILMYVLRLCIALYTTCLYIYIYLTFWEISPPPTCL